MASWITHMMVADEILNRLPRLDRRGFCVGNIAPDCNVENADWTAFTPPREVTHWMSSAKKNAADCERFWADVIEGRTFRTPEERSFFLGYYAHLITDACFQRFTRDELRVRHMLARIMERPELAARMQGMPQDYDAVKRAFSKEERLLDVDAIEYEYLRAHPDSGYLTVLLPLKAFPDYTDILPKGAIVRKIGVMAALPAPVENASFAFFSREEYRTFVETACAAVEEKLRSD